MILEVFTRPSPMGTCPRANENDERCPHHIQKLDPLKPSKAVTNLRPHMTNRVVREMIFSSDQQHYEMLIL